MKIINIENDILRFPYWYGNVNFSIPEWKFFGRKFSKSDLPF